MQFPRGASERRTELGVEKQRRKIKTSLWSGSQSISASILMLILVATLLGTPRVPARYHRLGNPCPIPPPPQRRHTARLPGSSRSPEQELTQAKFRQTRVLRQMLGHAKPGWLGASCLPKQHKHPLSLRAVSPKDPASRTPGPPLWSASCCRAFSHVICKMLTFFSLQTQPKCLLPGRGEV